MSTCPRVAVTGVPHRSRSQPHAPATDVERAHRGSEMAAETGHLPPAGSGDAYRLFRRRARRQRPWRRRPRHFPRQIPVAVCSVALRRLLRQSRRTRPGTHERCRTGHEHFRSWLVGARDE